MSVISSDFSGILVPPELVQFIATNCVTGAPFARSLTLLPTQSGSVGFPTVAPDSFDWVAEAQSLPGVDVNPSGPIVAVAKLAGMVGLGNEFISDNALPISTLLGQAIADAMGPKLDVGLLRGEGPPEPTGILASVTAAESQGTDFRTDTIKAWGELVDAGADPATIIAFANAYTVAEELARVTTSEGAPIHPDGAAAMVGPGIALIPVPSLDDGEVIVCDKSAVYLVQREDFTVEASTDYLFGSDQIALRIKGRFAVASPTVSKSMRTIGIPPSSG